jgi:hypothetical protein
MAGLTPLPKRPNIDWEGIEMHYRAGIRSLMDIAKEYGVSDAGILKRAKAKGWSRDLAGKIKARATAKLNEALVSGAVSAQRKSKEGAIVEAVSDQQVQAETDNRNDILLGMRVTRGQLNEVSAMADRDLVDDLKWLREIAVSIKLEQGVRPEVAARLSGMFDYVVSTPGRVKLSKEIAAAHAVYIPMQRKILKLDDDADRNQSNLDTLLAKINAAAD